ncbi:hypothetical protein AAMO2058_000060300, partial [Amorphochlora amoebiformis]
MTETQSSEPDAFRSLLLKIHGHLPVSARKSCVIVVREEFMHLHRVVDALNYCFSPTFIKLFASVDFKKKAAGESNVITDCVHTYVVAPQLPVCVSDGYRLNYIPHATSLPVVDNKGETFRDTPPLEVSSRLAKIFCTPERACLFLPCVDVNGALGVCTQQFDTISIFPSRFLRDKAEHVLHNGILGIPSEDGDIPFRDIKIPSTTEDNHPLFPFLDAMGLLDDPHMSEEEYVPEEKLQPSIVDFESPEPVKKKRRI